MGVDVLYCLSGLPEWIPVAKRLAEQLDWIPAYWMTQSSKNHQEVQRSFPDTIAHTFQDANRCIFPESLERDIHYPLDPPLLSSFLRHQITAMELMERMDLGSSFGYQERLRTYHRLLMFSLRVVERLEIGVAVFNTPPHSVAEYLFYAVCQTRVVPTAILTTTGIDGLILVNDSVEEPSTELRDAYRRKLGTPGPVDLVGPHQEYLARIRSNSCDKRPWYLRLVQAQQAKSHSRYENRVRKEETRRSRKPGELADYVRRELESGAMNESTCKPMWALEATHSPIPDKPAARADSRSSVNRVFKRHGQSLQSALLTRREYEHYRRSAYKVKLAYKERYSSLCEDVDLDASYVYVALHYQPERTTCPDGGLFVNQWLMVNMLSLLVPAGWLVYVKEHPTQFSFTGSGEQARSESFYEDLSSIENVRLVRLDQDSFELIDRARAVATVTGMSGWEAVCRGKPALVFGNAWYGLCEGVFRVTSRESCTRALDAIEGGFEWDPRTVDAFVSAVKEISARGYVNPSNAPGVDIDFESHVSELARILSRFGCRHAMDG